MQEKELSKHRRAIVDFMSEISPLFGNVQRRPWAEAYIRGLCLDGERKSIQPLADRLKKIDGAEKDYCQGLQQFISASPWDDGLIRKGLRTVVQKRHGRRGIFSVDDTGFVKQGRHSVGVARQYSGTLGKIGNCQIATSVEANFEGSSYCFDIQLYLPECWTEDRKRCQKAGVPDDINFLPKWEIALEMIRRLREEGFEGAILADSAYGSVGAFREELARDGWTYCVGIDSSIVVIDGKEQMGKPRRYEGIGRPPTRPERVRLGLVPRYSVKQLAHKWRNDFRQVTWRTGTKKKLCSRFAAWRVRPAPLLSKRKTPKAECWLVVEWPEDSTDPTRYFLSNMPPNCSVRSLVKLAKSRWTVEQNYREMKDELGLDHFEGRTWRGFHHHVTMVMLAYAFLSMQRSKKKLLSCRCPTSAARSRNISSVGADTAPSVARKSKKQDSAAART